MARISSKPKRAAQNDTATAREILLVAARKMFAQRGLSGTTIRDIAREARMNSSQISYYYSNKEGLYRACIQDIAEDRLHMAKQILVPPQSKEEFRVRLKLFIDNLFGHFLEDRDTGLIIIREYDRLHSPASKVFKAYFTELFELLSDFFSTAMKSNFVRTVTKNADSLTLTSLFFGLLMSELRFDHIKQDLFSRTLHNSEERRIVTNQIIDLFT